jgi:hypothetical protein
MTKLDNSGSRQKGRLHGDEAPDGGSEPEGDSEPEVSEIEGTFDPTPAADRTQVPTAASDPADGDRGSYLPSGWETWDPHVPIGTQTLNIDEILRKNGRDFTRDDVQAVLSWLEQNATDWILAKIRNAASRGTGQSFDAAWARDVWAKFRSTAVARGKRVDPPQGNAGADKNGPVDKKVDATQDAEADAMRDVVPT